MQPFEMVRKCTGIPFGARHYATDPGAKISNAADKFYKNIPVSASDWHVQGSVPWVTQCTHHIR